MAKKILNTGDAEKFIGIVTDRIFIPSAEQRRLKAAFWYTYSQGPTVDSDKITAACVSDILKTSAVEKWWSDPEFKDWFRNKDSFRQRAEYQAEMAQDIIEEIMINGKKDSDRLNAAKVAIDIAGKVRKTQPIIKLLDASVNDMEEKELDEFIAKRLGGVTDGTEKETRRN